MEHTGTLEHWNLWHRNTGTLEHWNTLVHRNLRTGTTAHGTNRDTGTLEHWTGILLEQEQEQERKQEQKLIEYKKTT
jgi:hypothetical protein